MNETTSVSIGASSSLDVLLVRDNSEDARLFAEYLDKSRLRATLRHEECLNAALSAVQEAHPHVLVVDLGLPDREGPATVRAVAREAPSVPIVVLTGEDDLRAALEAQKAGAAEYLKEGELTPGLVERTLRWAVERSEMRAKLRQRDTWIRSITENITGGVFRVGPTGRIQYANEALARMLGFAEDEELIGRDLTTFYAEDTERGRMVAAEGVDGAEIRFERRDGSELVGLLNAEPAYREGGKVLHYDGVITDITDRKAAEEQLRRREEQLRRINENISEGIYRSAPGEGLVYANQAFAEMFGYDSVEGVLDADPTTFYSDPEEREQLRETLHEQGHFEAVEVEFRRKDGSTFTGLLSGTVVRGEDEAVKFYDGAVTDVSDRVRRERKLRILSEAVDQAKEAVLITEAEPLEKPGPNIAYVNEAFEEMTGYTEEEVLGETPRILQGPETDREVLRSLREALEAGESWQGETVNYRKDGEPYRVQWNVAPVRNGDGEIEHWVSVQRDISDRKQREQELAHQKALLEAQSEATIDGLLAVDEDRNVAFYNERFLDIWEVPESIAEQDPLGKPLDHALLDSVNDLLEDPEGFREKVEYLYEHPDEESRDLVQLSDGRWLDRYSAPIVGDDGTHFGRLWVFRDITERERRERELETLNTRLQLALGSTNTGIFDWDMETDEVIWDETSERLFGYEPGGFPGTYQGWADRVHPDDLPDAEADIEQAIEAGDEYQTEFRVQLPNGTQRWIEARGVVEYEEDETPGRMIGIHTDVTERREREERLREAKEEAEKASRLKSAMLANMSHEIRTPLTSITGFAELLTDELDGKPATFSERIYDSGRRLMKTLDSVLELSKLEAGAYELPPETVRLDRVAEEAVDLLRPRAEERNVDLEASGADQPVEGYWNEGALNRIAENLIENAIKFTPEGGRVSVRVGETEGEAYLEVEDTGVGIGEEALPGIFEAFKQESEGLGREYEGTGLGLSIGKELTDRLGGEIEVESEKGEGTCVTVRLPNAKQSG